MDVTVVSTAAAGALVIGLTGSPHCAVMCGPLALAISDGSRAAATAWQLGRFFAYLLVGAVLGAASQSVGHLVSTSVQPYLPWVMAAGLVGSALGLGKRLKPVPGLSHLVSGFSKLGARFSPSGRAAAIGAATPFLPCGLLYGVLVTALATGSAVGGAVLMGAFALGSAPALIAAQLQQRLWARWPKASLWARRALPVVAAVVLVWRAMHTGAVAGEPPHCH